MNHIRIHKKVFLSFKILSGKKLTLIDYLKIKIRNFSIVVFTMKSTPIDAVQLEIFACKSVSKNSKYFFRYGTFSAEMSKMSKMK